MTLSWLVQNSETEVDTRVAADPKYIAAVDRWKACMNDNGYAYVHVGEPREEALTTYDSMSLEAARVEELAIATTDAECGRSASILTTAEGLEKKYRSQFEDENQGKLLAWVELEAQALDRAKELLASGG